MAGQYVSQQYFWRSGPEGIDAASFVLGNPFSGLWGAPVRAAYAFFGMNPIESVAWTGVIPLILAASALRTQRSNNQVRRWAVIGTVFLVWAGGAHLHVLGNNTAMISPAAILRFIPIVSNARIPGRAMVVVYLALAMLAAIAVKELRSRNKSVVLVALLASGILADFFAAPFPTVPVACPAIYQTLRERPERGSVAELPLGFGDGFGALTPIENRVMLACQTVHERPLVGGFVARLSPEVVAAYRSDPLLAAFLRLSGAGGDLTNTALPDRRSALEQMTRDEITFVLLDRVDASVELQEYVDHMLPLRLVASDGQRSLYVVDDIGSDSPAP
jgi:hypothetical protein